MIRVRAAGHIIWAGMSTERASLHYLRESAMTSSLRRVLNGCCLVTCAAALSITVMASAPASAQAVMRIAVNDDPDTIDPATSPTAISRIILNTTCEKLFDIDKDLNFVPRLVESYQWSDDGLQFTMKLRPNVKFQDDTGFDAEAVKFNFERNMTLPTSMRKSELSPIAAVDVVDPLTVRVTLKTKLASLVALLSDDAGVMISPKQGRALAEKFGTQPVCAGPFKFVSRIPQGKITYEKFKDYWDVKNIHIDRVEFTPINDSTVRLASLKAGDFDLLERMSPTDVPEVEKDSRLQLARSFETGYGFMAFNVANGPRSETLKDKRVRQAISLAIDRQTLVNVAFGGLYSAGGQFVPKGSPWYNEAMPTPKRDVEKAKQLLKEAGVPNLKFELSTRTDRDFLVPSQVMQAMLAEAGIQMDLAVKENVTQLADASAGRYDAYMSFWSGRVDIDGNIFNFYTCKASSNRTGFCNEKYDALIRQARQTIDMAERKKLYNQAQEIFNDEMPALLTWHRQLFIPMRKNVTGFVLYPDGMIRLRGVRVN